MRTNIRRNFSDWIIHETDDYIIINKPPNLSCLEDRIDNVNVQMLAQQYFSKAKLNHRIDKQTSGILVIAKNDEFYRYFSVLLEKRKVKKYYYALVWGVHNIENGLIEANIEVTKSGVVRLSKQGKPSSTRIRTIDVFLKNTLLECMPITGRKHQIRIHLSNYNAPIVNDSEYNGEEILLSKIKNKYKQKEFEEERPLINRFALHAHKIVFEDMQGNEISISAPLPNDFQKLLNILEKYK